MAFGTFYLGRHGPAVPVDESLDLALLHRAKLDIEGGQQDVPLLEVQGGTGDTPAPRLELGQNLAAPYAVNVPKPGAVPPPSNTPTPPAPEESPVWLKTLMAVAGGLEGWSAGMRGHVPAAVGLLRDRQHYDLIKQGHQIAERHYEEEYRQHILEIWRKAAAELAPGPWETFRKAIEPDIKKYWPQLLEYHELASSSPEARKATVGMLSDNPVMMHHLDILNDNYYAERARTAPNKLAALDKQHIEDVKGLLTNSVIHQDMDRFNLNELSQILAKLPAGAKKEMKGMTWDAFLNVHSSLRHADGIPLKRYLDEEITSGRPAVQDLLESYGVITPDKARRDAQSALMVEQTEKVAHVRAKVEQEAANAPLSDVEKRQAESIARYRQAPISQYALVRPGSRGLAIMAHVDELHQQAHGAPYDAATWPKRVQTIEAFARGPQADLVRSLSVVEDHITVFRRLAKAMGNKDVRAFNAIKQWFAQNLGLPEPRSFDEARRILGEETGKALIRAGGSAGERDAFVDAVTKADSPQAIEAVLQTREQLLGGQLEGLRRQYTEGTMLTNDDFDRLLSPDARRALRVSKFTGGAVPSTEPTSTAQSAPESGLPTKDEIAAELARRRKGKKP